MSGGRDTGYLDIESVGPVTLAKVHIPPCHQDQSFCQNRLSKLEKKLQEEGVECHHIYPPGGLFKNHYETFVEESHFTILHKCPAFWWKVRNLPSANYRTAPKEKLICVSLGKRELIYNGFISGQFRKEGTRQSYEAFFQDLHVEDISSESNLTAFVRNLVKNLPNTWSRTAATVKAENELPAAAGLESADGAYYADPAALMTYYADHDFLQSLQFPFVGEGQILEPVPDVFGHTNPGSYVFARADCLAVDTQPVFSKHIRFDRLREEIASWKKCTDQGTVQRNVQRMLYKDLPDLFDKRDSVRLAHLAVCQHPEIQDRALTFLELLLLQSQLEGTETKTAEFLVDILREMRTKMKERLTSVDQRLSDVYAVLQKCAKNSGKDVLPFRYDNPAYDEDSLYQYAKTFLDKSVATQAISIYEQLKKIFSHMHVRDASVLEKLVSLDSSPRKRAISLPLPGTRKLHGICKTLIFNGLVLFLRHGLRSEGQRDINPMCEKIFDILKVIAEKDIPRNKVRIMLEPLLYDHTPAIRRDAIQVLAKTGKDKFFSTAVYNAEEIKRALCPMLHTGVIEWDEMEETWWTFKGTFSDQPVIVFEEAYNDNAPIPRGHDRQLNTLLALEHHHIMKLFAISDSR